LLVRYSTTAEGKPVKKAEVYTVEDHHIDPALIDPDAKSIIRRLQSEGFKAFVVGGAVRDLLTGLEPKDFDIATDAFPRRIRKIFRHSRVIGRRFQIVHIYAHRAGKRKIFEVSTFRSSRSTNNTFGSMEEDVWRRDFTLNALYYCPVRQIIVDFVGGFKDIRAAKIRTLVRTDISFAEDPVRMIRGVKYAELTGFPLPAAATSAIKRHRGKLRECSPARLTEELYKILASGYSAGMLLQSFRLRLLEVVVPELHKHWRSLARRQLAEMLRGSLGVLDQRLRSEPSVPMSRGTMLAYLLKGCARNWELKGKGKELVESAAEQIRDTVNPLLPSRKECERAARLILRWYKTGKL
jgi:poly(A) polymerase